MITQKRPNYLSTFLEMLLIASPALLSIYLLRLKLPLPTGLVAATGTQSEAICEVGPCWIIGDFISPTPVPVGIILPIKTKTYFITSAENAKADLYVGRDRHEIRLSGVAVFRFTDETIAANQELTASDYRYLYLKDVPVEESFKIRFVGEQGIQLLNPAPDAPVFTDIRDDSPLRVAFISPANFEQSKSNDLTKWILEITKDDQVISKREIVFVESTDVRGRLFTADLALSDFGQYRFFSQAKLAKDPTFQFEVQKLDGFESKLNHLLKENSSNVQLEIRGP